jgi:formylglycine-generating enzyme required for sulfatase activity
MRAVRLVAVLVLVSRVASATDLSVSNVSIARVPNATNAHVTLNVAWQNAWRNPRNHDAAWMFAKVRTANGPWRHARVLNAVAQPVARILRPVSLATPPDRTGVFVFSASPMRGAVEWPLDLEVDLDQLRDLTADASVDVRVFAVEMVYVPEGSFTLGDPDPASLKFASVYRSNASGLPDGLIEVRSEEAISVGPTTGSLYYQVQQPEYQGDRQGPIPAEFPKGFRAFYAMKYELSQGLYAEFLNTLGEEATEFRAIHGGRDYYRHRGSIRLEDSRYVAAFPRRPANRVSWEDGIAFADWAGLRPMTELEFEKASRGTAKPIPHEFAWGTASTDALKRVMQPNDDLAMTSSADEGMLSDDTRPSFGASYYWVLDLAGSVWERVVSIGHPVGRAFKGSHGDGRLTGYGSATNEDWPRGDETGGGYGYRGDGYYEQGMRESEFNPYSPIAYRRFGAWGQAPRSLAYGFRAVRSAP